MFDSAREFLNHFLEKCTFMSETTKSLRDGEVEEGVSLAVPGGWASDGEQKRGGRKVALGVRWREGD